MFRITHVQKICTHATLGTCATGSPTRTNRVKDSYIMTSVDLWSNWTDLSWPGLRP